MIYLLIVTIALAIGFALYQLSLRNLTFFQWNRFYLVGMVLISLLIPIGVFIDLTSFLTTRETLPVIYFSDIIAIEAVPIIHTNTSLDLMDMILFIYWTGVGIGTLFMCYKLWKVRMVIQQRPAHSSFSFFNKIVLGSNVKDIQEINEHERVHVRQGHSYDIALLELVGIFLWFNPIVYYIKRELKFQHECIADEICSTDKVSYAELLLAHAMHTDSNLLQHEFSNQSFLKKRIMMLFKNKSTNNKKLFYLSAIPLLAVLVLSTLVFNTSNAKEIVNGVEGKVEDLKLPTRITYRPSEQIANVEQSIQRPSVLQIADTIKREKSQIAAAEVHPEPPEGMATFRRWISNNYTYPQEAIDAGVVGTIIVSFVVEKDGTLSDIKVTQDIGYGTGEAAIQLMKKSPNWSAGIQDEVPVRVQYSLPIKLDLSKK